MLAQLEPVNLWRFSYISKAPWKMHLGLIMAPFRLLLT